MTNLTPNDFSSNLPVKWCPGCGDFAILTSVKKAMAELGIEHEKYVVVSGIGCSSRFPYYVNTYGFHTIHGRAIPIATGIKLSKPELMVFVVTGDGDCLSIGGNHIIHGIRRNIGLKVLMFNNRIYALTKGQASPTTMLGSKTKTTPIGNIDYPFNPMVFAVGLGCPFAARAIDSDINGTTQIITEAARNEGFAFIEVIQKCVVFTEKEFDLIKNPQTKDDVLLKIENGKPMIFGKDRNKAIVVENNIPRIVEFSKGSIPSNLTIYDQTNINLAYTVASLMPPEFPLPVGVFLKLNKKSYENLFYESVVNINKFDSIGDILKDGTYEIK
ncbi:MAG: 2-oxoacid:ferredoxin oxidoreductase subunit beta [Elusimicrobiota bacterium]